MFGLKKVQLYSLDVFKIIFYVFAGDIREVFWKAPKGKPADLGAFVGFEDCRCA